MVVLHLLVFFDMRRKFIAEDYSRTFFLKHQESVVNLYIHCYTICDRALKTCLLAISCSFYTFIIEIGLMSFISIGRLFKVTA